MGTERKFTLTYEGKTMSLYEWAQALSFSYKTIYSRYKAGKFTPGQILGLEPMPERKAPNKGLHPQRYERVCDYEITINGETKTLRRWARDAGMDWTVVRQRIRKGWTYEQALGFELTPKEKRRHESQKVNTMPLYGAGKELSDKGIAILCSAIALQAANDYRQAMKRLKVAPDDLTAQGRIIEVEQFFRSAYFQTMVDCDPEYIIEGLKKETNSGNKRAPYGPRKRNDYLGAAHDNPGKAVRNGTIIYKNITS